MLLSRYTVTRRVAVSTLTRKYSIKVLFKLETSSTVVSQGQGRGKAVEKDRVNAHTG
jgi:hypothetical protein